MSDFHFFANHAIGWATGATEEEAIEKLMLQNTDPTWARNCLKGGVPLVFFSCRVPLPIDAPYRINWYQPEVDGISECKNHEVLYLTKTKYAIRRDPHDKIKQLEHALEAATKEEAA